MNADHEAGGNQPEHVFQPFFGRFPFHHNSWRGLEQLQGTPFVSYLEHTPGCRQACLEGLNRAIVNRLQVPDCPRVVGTDFPRLWAGKDVYVSHNWGTQSDGITDNHALVMQLLEELEAQFGWNVFIDNRDLAAVSDMEAKMREEIETCGVFVVCITRRYMEKLVNGRFNDNCRFEWRLGRHHRGDAGLIIPLALEAFEW